MDIVYIYIAEEEGTNRESECPRPTSTPSANSTRTVKNCDSVRSGNVPVFSSTVCGEEADGSPTC